jgi:hypothetical protein
MRAVADVVNSNYDKLTTKKWTSTRRAGRAGEKH